MLIFIITLFEHFSLAQVCVYEKLGAGMDWHVDDVLYDLPQVKVVFTLENTLDCTNRWQEKGGEICGPWSKE